VTELEKQMIKNMEPITDKGKSAVNMKSIIVQSNEPMHFFNAFQGELVVQTNDFLKRQLENEDSEALSYVMLFQLIGVPSLN